MSVFIMICKRPECRAEYEAGPDDIAKGIAWWALCPTCRQSDAAELPTVPTHSHPEPTHTVAAESDHSGPLLETPCQNEPSPGETPNGSILPTETVGIAGDPAPVAGETRNAGAGNPDPERWTQQEGRTIARVLSSHVVHLPGAHVAIPCLVHDACLPEFHERNGTEWRDNGTVTAFVDALAKFARTDQTVTRMKGQIERKRKGKKGREGFAA